MSINTLTLTASTVTMTSLKLVEFINAHRKELAEVAGVPFPSKGYAKLEHKSLLAKVPEVLGAETSAKFFADLPDSYGRLQPVYRLPKREACLMAMSYSYALQARVYDHMTELEARQAAGPDLTTDEGKLLLIQDLVSKQLALMTDNKRIESERDEAVRTKALIGSRREATAMATASAAKREADRLRDQLGCNTRHATVIAVEKKLSTRFGKQDWRQLKAWCIRTGAEGKKVHDPRWGEAVAWPAGAWLAVFGVDLVELFGELAA